MSAETVQKLIWILIYAGMLVLGLGLSITRSDAAFGWALVSLGGVAVVAGIVLIVVRSRMKG